MIWTRRDKKTTIDLSKVTCWQPLITTVTGGSTFLDASIWQEQMVEIWVKDKRYLLFGKDGLSFMRAINKG